MNEENLYSARAAAKKLGISISTMNRHIRSGKIIALRILDSQTKNLRYAIPEAAIEDYLKTNI
ncbi:helix-turn-helix domain-containing protein [Deinococcus radiomollis]|uniref:helix-turn-helix domain-containing protein n=1 Tax=Deinococcus radiomollis TaxID=468916 RepID=UPI0038927E45